MGQFHRLVYSSRAHFRGTRDLVEGVANIVGVSHRNNTTAGIASALMIHRGCFVQILEGARLAVDATLARISSDGRHRNLVVLLRDDGDERALPNYGMMLIGSSSEGRYAIERLAANADGDLAAASPQALLQTLSAIALREAVPLPDAEPEWQCSDDVPLRLDTERLRAELASAHLGRGQPDAAREPRPEDAAVDAVLAIALFSAGGAAVRANDNYCAMLGYRPGDVAGLPYETLIAAEDKGRLHRLWEGMARGETVTLHHRGLRRDGAEVWLESTFRPRIDAHGRLLDVTEIAADQTDKQLRHADDRGQIQAINASQAVIHFTLDGTVLDANALFLDAMGYALDEIVGQHHRIFVDPEHAWSADYRTLWTDLAAGQHRAGEYRRLGKGGRPVWLQATYSPIVDMGGRPFKVVKYASVVTEAKLRQADYQWQIAAIHKSHAVITFDLSGVILDANDQFLEAVGYDLEEIVGRHHRMFVDPSYAHGAEYAAFWRELARGRHQVGQFKRQGRDGREIWVQAT